MRVYLKFVFHFCLAFEMNALIHNGQTYEAVLPVKHCPSNSGCRSVVKQANGNTQFQLTENFLLSLKVIIFLFYFISTL